MNVDEALKWEADWREVMPMPTIGDGAAMTALAGEVRRLRAENEALRRDAERYRWLRTADGVPITHEEARDPAKYDAAIDAALAAKHKP